jgi:hypothetical protein
MSIEIYYLVAYDIDTRKWRSADDTLGILTENQGPVYVSDEATESGEWGDLTDGIEKDIDFDNTQNLTEFLRGMNSSP